MAQPTEQDEDKTAVVTFGADELSTMELLNVMRREFARLDKMYHSMDEKLDHLISLIEKS